MHNFRSFLSFIRYLKSSNIVHNQETTQTLEILIKWIEMNGNTNRNNNKMSQWKIRIQVEKNKNICVHLYLCDITEKW